MKNIKNNNAAESQNSQNKTEIKKLIFVSLIIVFLLFGLFIFTQNKPQLQSYDKKEGSTYTLLEISDEDFLDKIKFGKTSEIEQMLHSGANVNAVDAKGQNAFTIAALFNGKPEVAQILKKGGVDINYQDTNGYTPLMKSIISAGNSYKFINELIKLGANVNLKTTSGITALSVAASSNNDENVIEALIKAGAEVNYINKDCSTPIMVAAKINTNPKVIEAFINHGAKTSQKDLRQLLFSCYKDNKQINIKDSKFYSVYDIAKTNPSLARDTKLMEKLKKGA
ncbi:MAG: ankyrin repeat domain-containing protein [Alphaproteobacteria bacterium]|nr:ankyrin repeat domain-containing protein [Alphaproteobacteria bacterium]